MTGFDDLLNFRDWSLQQQQAPALTNPGDKMLVVLKQHRFYKQLCLELYKAPITQAGKLKNPLSFINPLDLVWKTVDPAQLKFFSGIARFQNNATLTRSSKDIEALLAVIANPLQLSFYFHDKNVSENIVATSLKLVSIGTVVEEVSIMVTKKGSQYVVEPQITIDKQGFGWNAVTVMYDYFILLKGSMHLISNFAAVQALQLFPAGKKAISMHESRFADFKHTVLDRLSDHIPVYYSFITAATEQQIATGQIDARQERFIYLSELGDFIMVEPIVRYGEIDIPIRTKRQVFASNAKGKQFLLQRNDEEEIKFTVLLVKQHAWFAEQLDNDLPYFYLHRKKFLEETWFLNAFDTWQEAGITVLGFNKIKGNKLNPNKAKINIRVTSGTNWFNTKIDVRFGNKKASLKQLQQAIRNKHQYVQLDDGTHGILPANWLDRFTAYFNAGEVLEDELQIPKVKFSELEQLFDAANMDNEVKQELSLFHEAFENFDSIQPVKTPQDLHTELRHYQQHGLNWLNFLDDHNFGGVLADDMGLGKTIQVLAFILLQRQKTNRNTNLLVVPTSLIFNWEAEIKKFAPSIKLHIIENARKAKELQAFNGYELILVSYGILVTAINYLRKYAFHYVFIDEAQQIKNIDSQRYRAVRLLQSRNRMAITGTPMENNVFDLYAQMSFVNPGLLGNKQYFRDTYSIPIDRFKNNKRAKELQQKLAPFILRRTKEQVASELPQKTEMLLYCPMDTGQRKVYDAYETAFRDSIEAETEDEIKSNSMRVLRGLTRLRQICNSPLLLEDEKLYAESAAKIEVLIEQIESKSGQHKILIFSQFVGMLQLIKKELTDRNIPFEWLTGTTKDRKSAVNNFQENPNVRVFLISLKAGGTGLNLTEADYIFLVDPWWNPAVENQAIDRSYRIGQHKPVIAVRLICPDTIEEKIMQLQEVKRELTADVVKTDTAIYKTFTKNELLQLLR